MSDTPAGRRLLMFNLIVDADDANLGFASEWISELARYWSAVDVVTMRKGRVNVPDNVRVFSLGKEAGYGELRRAVRFYRVLVRLLRTHRYDVCFAHMMPLFVAMGAPVLRFHGLPVVMWFAHGTVPTRARVAHRVSRSIVTSSREGFPLTSNKVHVIGQAIDTERFTPDGSREEGQRRLLTVARISRIKRLEVFVDLAAALQARELIDRATIVGPIYDPSYYESLCTRIADRALESIVEIVGPLRADSLVNAYRAADIFINTSDTDSLDKAALEAMSCGVPVVTTNASLSGFVSQVDPGLSVAKGDLGSLLNACETLLRMGGSERARLGAVLRDRVVQQHGRARFFDRLDEVLSSVTSA